VHLTRLLRKKGSRSTRSSRTHIFEFHGEKRGDLYFTKDICWRSVTATRKTIAANRAADARSTVMTSTSALFYGLFRRAAGGIVPSHHRARARCIGALLVLAFFSRLLRLD